MKTARYSIAGSLILCFFLSFTETYGASSAHTVGQDTKKPSLYWVHKDTGRKIFGLEDIVAFDWDKGLFQLKEEAAMNMRLYPVGTTHDPFEIRSDDQVIFEGVFGNMLSSTAYKGPAISTMYHFSEAYSPIFQLGGLRDSPYSRDDTDYSKPLKDTLSAAGLLNPIHIDNPPLKEIFSEAGLLKPINPDNPPAQIHCKKSSWTDEKTGLRVRLDLFTDTFVSERIARFHFRLNSTRSYPNGDYVIETQTTLTADQGMFTQSFRRTFPVSQKYLWAAHPVGFILPSEIKDDKGKRVEACSAELIIEIAIRRVLDQKQGTYSEPIETLKTEPFTLTIQSPNRNGLSSDAKIMMQDFRQALQKQDWQNALTFCSEAVQKKANSGPLKEFFETYTSLEKLTSDAEFHVSGMSMNVAKQPLGYECFFMLSGPAEHPCLNWVWHLKKNETNNTWAIDFPVISVSEQMESQKQGYLQGQQEMEERDRFLRKSLKTTLVPIQDEYIIGKPMLFRLEVTNVSDSVVTFSRFSNSVMVNNPLSVKGPDGREVLYIGGDCQTSGTHKDFAQGETKILEPQYDAASDYLIINPGKYTFQFRGSHPFPAPDDVTLEIKPGNPGPCEEIIRKILSVKPEHWSLSTVKLNSLKSTKSNSHLNLMAGLMHYSLKTQFSVSLLIYIDPNEDFPANYTSSDFEPEKLGQSPWGPVYVLDNHADLFWPDYRESLVRGLDLKE